MRHLDDVDGREEVRGRRPEESSLRVLPQVAEQERAQAPRTRCSGGGIGAQDDARRVPCLRVGAARPEHPPPQVPEGTGGPVRGSSHVDARRAQVREHPGVRRPSDRTDQGGVHPVGDRVDRSDVVAVEVGQDEQVDVVDAEQRQAGPQPLGVVTGVDEGGLPGAPQQGRVSLPDVFSSQCQCVVGQSHLNNQRAGQLHRPSHYASSMTHGDESPLETTTAPPSDETRPSPTHGAATATEQVSSSPQNREEEAAVRSTPQGVGPLGVRPLTPIYDKEAHGDTVKTLLDLVGSEHSAESIVRNVAVAGPYGSGKSSVLLQFQKELKTRAINISLSSLSSIDPELDVAADRDGRPLPTTNFIQKEVIKQLLYRGQPADFPESRYSRIYRQGNGPDIAVGAGVATAWIAVAGLTRLTQLVAKTFTDGNARASWALILVVAFTLGAASFSIFGALKRRFSIQSVTAGPAAITLEGRNTYYFDEYLDEIVYYFEESPTDVVIFEDIDRFDDTHIFESLRNLNVILNNAAQVGRPIYFVYAVRDSIFGSLQTSRGGRIAVDTLGSRTKFFDAIVPLVPFITYKTARDLLGQELSGIEHAPDSAVVAAVGEHISDMRLLRNIVNEYRIFARVLLRGGTLLDLTPEALFAMVSYKNLAPRDFEDIRSGVSNLDYLQDQLEALAIKRIREIDVEIAQAQKDRKSAALSSPQLRQRIDDLLARVDAVTLASRGASYLSSFRVDSGVFSANSEQREPLTRALLEADEATFGNLTLNKSQLETLAGGPLKQSAASKDGERTINDRIRRRQNERAALANGNFATYIRSATIFNTTAGKKDAREIAAALLGPNSDLWIAMISAGHLDQNYTIYTAQYYGTTLSPDGLSFVIRNVQRNKPDFQHKFSRIEDIGTIVSERGEPFFREDSALNLDIVNYLTEQSERGLELLASRISGSDRVSLSFLSIYVRSEVPVQLWRALSKRWAYAVEFLADEDGLQAVRAAELLSETLQSPIPFEVSEHGTAFLQGLADALPVLSIDDDSVAANVSKHYERFDARVKRLSTIAPAMRKAFLQSGRYAITRENVLIATSTEQLQSLNALRRNFSTTYKHILPHVTDLLKEREVSDGAALIDDDSTITVVNEAAKVAPDAITLLVEASDKSISIQDLSKVRQLARLPLFSRGRVALTQSNLRTLVADADTIPAAALPFLEEEQSFSGSQDEPDTSLAILIANDERISVESRVYLLKSSGVTLSADAVETADVLGGLVEIGVVEDDAVTARQAVALGPSALADFVSISDDWPAIANRIGIALPSDGVAAILNSAEVRSSDIAATVDLLPSWRIIDQPVLKSAIARCVEAADIKLSGSALAWIASAGPPVDVAILLARVAQDLEASEIYTVTDRMGSEFRKLSSPRGRATLPDHPAIISILMRLQATGGFVTSWKPFQGDIRVWFGH